jgi:prevent-host-death family protein
MTQAAVSQLKASVSEYLARVKAGEEILITDRGAPIAKIIPLNRGGDMISTRMAHLERAGLARVGKGAAPEGLWGVPGPEDSAGRALAVILEERESER